MMSEFRIVFSEMFMLCTYSSVGVQGATRLKPCNSGHLLRYLRSVYVQVHLFQLPCKWLELLRLRSKSREIDDFCPFKAFDRRVLDVRGVKITRKGQKSVISRPYCPFVHRRYHDCIVNARMNTRKFLCRREKFCGKILQKSPAFCGEGKRRTAR